MLDEITFLFLGCAFARLHADDAFPTSPLRAKRTHGRALDKARMGYADDTTFICDEIFHVDLRFIAGNFRQARRTVFVPNFAQFSFDDAEDALFFGEDVT
jgi:hypothetical protein